MNTKENEIKNNPPKKPDAIQPLIGSKVVFKKIKKLDWRKPFAEQYMDLLYKEEE